MEEAVEIASESAESANAYCQAAKFHAESASESASSATMASVEAQSYANSAEQSKNDVSAMLGDMHTALDGILAIQSGLIGGAV